jgi:hypothetical protein
MNEQEIIEIAIPFLWLIIPLIALISFYKIRTNYKVQQLKTDNKERKKEETISGGISKMISDAPSQLKQIDSEIATLQQKCKLENISPEQEKELLSRLMQERDMLSYAVKYGDLAKPFLKPIDKILNNFMGKLGN